MEVKEGYKKTEVGLIPQEWECVELGSISRYEGGSQPPLFTFSNIKKKDYIRLIQIRDYKTDKYATYIPISLARRFCNENEIMIGRYGPPIFQILQGIKGAYNVALMKAIPLQKITNDFLYYTLKRDDLFRYIDLLSQRSSGQTGVDLIGLKAFLIALPPLPEQQTIASALSDIDRLINSLTKLIDKKKNIKQGAMQQLLTGKKRLTGYIGGCVKKTEIGMIPQDWDCLSIGEITTVRAGGTPSTSVKEYWGGHIRWMNSGELNKKRVYEVAGRITEEGLKNSSTSIIPVECVLIGLAGQGKTRGTVAINYVELCTNQSIAAIFPTSKILPELLYQYLDSLYDYIRELSSGDGGRGGLNLRIIKSLLVPIPSMPEQQAIIAALSDMDAEIESLQNKLNKYIDIKQGMMQELLTGRIRLEKASNEVKPVIEVGAYEKPKKSGHTKEFDEAVVISAIVSRFASERFPIGAFKRQKFSYLLHRHHDNKAAWYEKFAAGPYNYHTKYGGAEKIARGNKYVKEYSNDKIKGFVADGEIQQALVYFYEWYGKEALDWLEQFRYYKNEELELLTTVDIAVVELRQDKKTVSVSTVKSIIQSSDEWKPKLSRKVFSDINIKRAIESSNRLFGN